MKKFFILTIMFLFCANTFAKRDTTQVKRQVFAKRSNEVVKLDGKLTEEVWKNNPVDEFVQRDPVEGEMSTQKTNVWVAYDENNLYIAARLYDSNPDSISTRLGRRDDFVESDWFAIFIDSYNDKRNGFYFAVNPSGSIADGTMFNDSWDDESWDGIWEAVPSIDENGWIVEMKIPFSQLRFNSAQEIVWGINFRRDIQRRNEESYFVMVPKNESGFVSRFAELHGLNGIQPGQSLQVLPYVVQKAQYLIHDSNDPFYKSQQYKTSFGADIKWGLSSNLTLDATVNPDFGQVEVDPAELNLSAFETYYQEKRPFFIEGANLLYFGNGGINNNWGMNFGNPEIVYSRRIGRQPQGYTTHDGYTKIPNETRILGAAKLTGKVLGDWNFYGLNATTDKVYGITDSLGHRFEEVVEPLTNFSAIRLQKQFNDGDQGLGFMGTTVFRDLSSNSSLQKLLAEKSFVIGVDGWTALDEDGEYMLNGYFSGSHVSGSKEYLVRVQRSSIHYFQRPDAEYFKIDSSRTSLSGWVGRVMLNKQKGSFYINTAFGAYSPGYEINDLGFQWNSNIINGHVVIGYRIYESDEVLFRRKHFYAATFRNVDFDGNIIGDGYMLNGYGQFLNYWSLSYNSWYSPRTLTRTGTRGGPMMMSPSYQNGSIWLNSDSRKDVVVGGGFGLGGGELGNKYRDVSLSLQWKPLSNLDIKVNPGYDYSLNKTQWVTRVNDVLATETFGTRYIYAELNQKTFYSDIRVNWTFTPTFSLQLYAQPYFTTGDYNSFKEYSSPRSLDYKDYGSNGSTLSYDPTSDSYTADPDGSGAASSFSFGNPDFNFKSLRGNLVLRWEYNPGSVFYFVWTQDKTDFQNPADFSLGRDFSNLIDAESNNIFMVKFTYWLGY